jgi:phosphatidylglycerol lysyltransferase
MSSRAGALEALRRFGTDAVSFQGLEPGHLYWDDPATGAIVIYRRSRRCWLAIGSPLIEPAHRGGAARRFAAAAGQAGCRAVFVAVEDLAPFAGFRRRLIGEQSELRPSQWDATLRRNPRLREQLRRARAKHVTVRRVAAEELAEGTPLRREVERLRDEWLASRPMEPMQFLVAIELFHEARERFYVLAERNGRPIQFLAAAPIYARSAWLLEDMLRGRDAVNGTTELIIDYVMRSLGGEPHWITPGLTPLAGAQPRWMTWTRIATSPLYDFTGLYRFRSRLHPSRWSPVWLVWDRGMTPLVLLDLLNAFAGGNMLRFAARTILVHPNGPPWAVAVPLVAWIVLLIALSLSGYASVLAFSTLALWAWIVFDVALAALLFRAARHPRPGVLAWLSAAAAIDAILSVRHFTTYGFGSGAVEPILRFAATAGPIIGATALAWAAWRAVVMARRRVRQVN